MWGATRKVTLLGALPSMLAALTSDEKDAARRAVLEEMIAKRKADERFTVEVQHIGSAEDPTRFEQLTAEENAKRHAARVRARRACAAEGDPLDDVHIASAMDRDPAWSREAFDFMRAWILAGVVNGKDELPRLYELGERLFGAGGGTSLVIDAAIEAKRYQHVTEDEGKG